MNDPRKALFDRAAQLHREIEVLRQDLKELSVEFNGCDNGMDKEMVADVLAAAKISAQDAVKRERAEEKRARRMALAEELAGVSSKPATVARVEGEKRQVAAARAQEGPRVHCRECGAPNGVDRVSCHDCGVTLAMPYGNLARQGPERITDLDRPA